MHISIQFALVCVCVCVCAASAEGAGAGGGRLVRGKQPRATRGFKNAEMMTARGFGKRNLNAPRAETVRRPRAPRVFRNSELGVARGFGKRNADSASNNDEVFGLENFWDMLEAAPERSALDNTEEKVPESIPVDWFVDEMLNNPDFARTVVRKFLDANQDGALSPEELLRNVY